MIKALMKLGIEVIYLNIIKATHNKHIANITLIRGKLKPFQEARVSTLSTLIQHSLGIPDHNNKMGRKK
jgi:hypothetical protein